MNRKPNFDIPEEQDQKGQSIVIIALVLIGLLAFAGLAVDVGLIFARSSQLQAAVDAAALAAVTEITSNTASDIVKADIKAAQFLSANGVPTTTVETMQSSSGITPLKATLYSLTATWPVELFFLQFIGRDIANVTKSATAAYYALTDIYASRRVESGVLATSNQSVFGPNICIDPGDPYSPNNSPWRPGIYTYQYRIMIPEGYEDESDIVRVELFDPDSYNATGGGATATHSDIAVLLGDPLTEDFTCPYGADQRFPCLMATDEEGYVGPQTLPDDTVVEVELDNVNPFWFLRVDANNGSGAPPGNGTCNGRPDPYNPAFNTQTEYKLSYFRQNPDGTIEEVPLTQYTGQINDGSFDNGDHETDMRWVSPGGALGPDQTANVPVDAGWTKDFEISIANDLQNIVTDPETGVRYIYLGVTAVYGASENGFEIWAGPPTDVDEVPTDVNERNLYILSNPGAHNSNGVTVFGLGNLPMNSNFVNEVDIPLIYVSPQYAGQKVYVSLYDSDSGATPPITFYFDSIATEDWSMTFGVAGQPDPDGVADGVRCKPGSCGTQWVDPPYQIDVPGILDNCDYANPTQEDCTPFYGGRLIARYRGGFGDTYGWEIRLTGVPYLVK